MKPSIFLAAALMASALGGPALAHSGSGPHVHVGSADLVLGPTYPRPVWAHRIDPSILHPIPKRPPLPWPGPVCLSCPVIDMEQDLRVLPMRR